MSYYKCKNISVKPEKNQIFVTAASSNVRPITYYKNEYAANGKYSLKEKLMYLMISMLDGNIQISKLNKNTIPFEYATLKVREYYRKKDINLYDEKYDLRYELYKKELSKYVDTNDWEKGRKFEQENKELVDKIETDIKKELYKEELEIFIDSIKENNKDKYYIKDYFGRTIEYVGETKSGYKYRIYEEPNEACLLDYKLAYIIQKRMGNKFKINRFEKQLENTQDREEDNEEEY